MEEIEKKEKIVEFKGFFLKYGIRFLVTLVIGITSFLLVFLLRNKNLIDAVDGLFVGGVIGISLGLFSFINNQGFFDIFAYNFLKVRNTISKKPDENFSNLNGTFDYTESKKFIRKQNRFVPIAYISGAGLILVVTLILYIIYKII